MVTSEFNCILVPLDGSPISEQVLTSVTSIAHGTGSSVVLLQVLPVRDGIRRLTAPIVEVTAGVYPIAPRERGH